MEQIGITKNFITVIFFFLSNHSMVTNADIHFMYKDLQLYFSDFFKCFVQNN